MATRSRRMERFGTISGAVALAAAVASMVAFALRPAPDAVTPSATAATAALERTVNLAGEDELEGMGPDAAGLARAAAEWSDDEGLGITSLSVTGVEQTPDGCVVRMTAPDGRRCTCVWTRGALSPYGFALATAQASPCSESAPPARERPETPGFSDILPPSAASDLPGAIQDFLSLKGVSADGTTATLLGDTTVTTGDTVSFVAECAGRRIDIDYHGDTGRFGMALLP